MITGQAKPFPRKLNKPKKRNAISHDYEVETKRCHDNIRVYIILCLAEGSLLVPFQLVFTVSFKVDSVICLHIVSNRLLRHQLTNLHNTKTRLYFEREKTKKKTTSFFIFKDFQISFNLFFTSQEKCDFLN